MWQSVAESQTQALLGHLGESAKFESVEVREDPALDQQAGDVCLTTEIIRNQDRYKIYIYKDEADVDVNGEWYPFELPDWNRDPHALLEGFLKFLRGRLETTRGVLSDIKFELQH